LKRLKENKEVLLIKKAKLFDPLMEKEEVCDLLIEKGRIKGLGKGIEESSALVIEGEGKWVFPGLVDLHVHLRDLGESHKETIFTGSGAGALGGFTLLVNMPNTLPPLDSWDSLRLWKERVKREALVEVRTMVCLSKGRRGRELSPLDELCSDPYVVGITDDGNPFLSEPLLEKALEFSERKGVIVASHPEDGPQVGAFGKVTFSHEPLYVERDLKVLEKRGGRLHLQHISMAESLPLIRKAKEKGLRVSCEVTPHHLLLSQGEIADGRSKVNPPLRSKRDCEALKEALREGLIDVIATDHAPHAPWEKEGEWEQIPFGISGLETALSLIYTEFVLTGLLSPFEMLRKMSLNPMRILGLSLPTVREGEEANLVIFDPHEEWVVDEKLFFSCAKKSPFNGRKLKGRVWGTIVKGKLIVKDRRLLIA
jgi:dihydroorotase